jgi:PadR family transcriptional regulator PadR
MKAENYQLGELEELVLMVVAILQDQAYGVRVIDEIKGQTDRNVNISSVHTVLDRLEGKGFLISEMGGSSAERGGRRKRIFSITSLGKQALNYVYETRNQLFAQMPHIIQGI